MTDPALEPPARPGPRWSDTAESIPSRLDVVWQWSYEIDIETLRRLYAKAKRDQWNADVEIDWDREIDPAVDLLDSERMPFRTTRFWEKLSKTQKETFAAHNAAYMLSQFLHGEQGAMMVAAALVHAVPDYEAKLYAATQTMDEARHVEVFERYLKKLDKIYPIDTALRDLLDDTLGQESWVNMLIGMQMIVEGLALGSFINMHEATQEPLFRDLLGYVIKDESRHVGYGNVYVRRAVEDMHPDELAAAEDFAFEAFALMRKSRFSSGAGMGQRPVYEQVLCDSGIDPADFTNAMIEEYQGGWRPKALPGQIHTFKGRDDAPARPGWPRRVRSDPAPVRGGPGQDVRRPRGPPGHRGRPGHAPVGWTVPVPPSARQIRLGVVSTTPGSSGFLRSPPKVAASRRLASAGRGGRGCPCAMRARRRARSARSRFRPM